MGKRIKIDGEYYNLHNRILIRIPRNPSLDRWNNLRAKYGVRPTYSTSVPPDVRTSRVHGKLKRQIDHNNARGRFYILSYIDRYDTYSKQDLKEYLSNHGCSS